jgi:hypothetical protein
MLNCMAYEGSAIISASKGSVGYDNLWSAISALSAAVGAIVIMIAAVYAHFQVKEARLSRNVALLLSFQDKYHSLPAREFRRRLLAGELGQPKKFDFDRLNAEDFHRLWQLLDQLEVLGALVDRGLRDFDLGPAPVGELEQGRHEP